HRPTHVPAHARRAWAVQPSAQSRARRARASPARRSPRPVESRTWPSWGSFLGPACEALLRLVDALAHVGTVLQHQRVPLRRMCRLLGQLRADGLVVVRELDDALALQIETLAALGQRSQVTQAALQLHQGLRRL